MVRAGAQISGALPGRVLRKRAEGSGAFPAGLGVRRFEALQRAC